MENNNVGKGYQHGTFASHSHPSRARENGNDASSHYSQASLLQQQQQQHQQQHQQQQQHQIHNQHTQQQHHAIASSAAVAAATTTYAPMFSSSTMQQSFPPSRTNTPSHFSNHPQQQQQQQHQQQSYSHPSQPQFHHSQFLDPSSHSRHARPTAPAPQVPMPLLTGTASTTPVGAPGPGYAPNRTHTHNPPRPQLQTHHDVVAPPPPPPPPPPGTTTMNSNMYQHYNSSSSQNRPSSRASSGDMSLGYKPPSSVVSGSAVSASASGSGTSNGIYRMPASSKSTNNSRSTSTNTANNSNNVANANHISRPSSGKTMGRGRSINNNNKDMRIQKPPTAAAILSNSINNSQITTAKRQHQPQHQQQHRGSAKHDDKMDKIYQNNMMIRSNKNSSSKNNNNVHVNVNTSSSNKKRKRNVNPKQTSQQRQPKQPTSLPLPSALPSSLPTTTTTTKTASSGKSAAKNSTIRPTKKKRGTKSKITKSYTTKHLEAIKKSFIKLTNSWEGITQAIHFLQNQTSKHRSNDVVKTGAGDVALHQVEVTNRLLHQQYMNVLSEYSCGMDRVNTFLVSAAVTAASIAETATAVAGSDGIEMQGQVQVQELDPAALVDIHKTLREKAFLLRKFAQKALSLINGASSSSPSPLHANIVNKLEIMSKLILEKKPPKSRKVVPKVNKNVDVPKVNVASKGVNSSNIFASKEVSSVNNVVSKDNIPSKEAISSNNTASKEDTSSNLVSSINVISSNNTASKDDTLPSDEASKEATSSNNGAKEVTSSNSVASKEVTSSNNVASKEATSSNNGVSNEATSSNKAASKEIKSSNNNHNIESASDNKEAKVVVAIADYAQNNESCPIKSGPTVTTNSSARKRKPNSKIESDAPEKKLVNPRKNGKKRKRKRGEKSDDVKTGDNSSEVANILAIANSMKNKASGPKLKIKDRQPNRITNPLLELPCYQSVPKSFMLGSLPVGAIPQGAEFWKIMNLFFPEPDTFPISYHAKILGFDIDSLTSYKYGEHKDLKQFLSQQCKDDEWKHLPALGKFAGHLNRITCKNKIDVDDYDDNEEMLEEVDPTWIAIMKQYRGYRDDLYKASTEISKHNVMSSDCLKMARAHSLVDSEMQFRLASFQDIESLSNFNEDVSSKIESNIFTNAIKCGSQFIILAESKTLGLIGYAHYRFCWFRQIVDNSMIDTLANPRGIYMDSFSSVKASKNIAERVIHIENVRCKKGNDNHGTSISDGVDSLTPLILVSLLLEHARRFVGYGMMECDSYAVPFYKTYFRMTPISDDSSHQNETRFLGIDLEKCSYRYALLKKVEEMKQDVILKKSRNKNDRMLIVLPTFQEATGTRSQGGNSEGMKKWRHSQLNNLTNVKEVSSPDKSAREAKVRVKVDKSSSKVSVIGKKKKTQMVLGDTWNWNILRRFPLSPTQDTLQENNDTVFLELQERQSELLKAEESILPKLWSLYKNAYTERLNFESDAGKRAGVKSELKQYKRLLERRREEQKAWELQQEQEENAVCDICYDGESTGENRIIFCDSCNISVHQSCYGIEKVPSEDYFCHACLYFKREKRENSTENQIIPHQSTETKLSDPLPTFCEVCPRRQGAFIQTYIKPTKKRGKIVPKQLSPKWVHVVCAKWHCFQFVDPSSGEVVDNGNVVEDVTEFKNYYRLNDYQCCLCEGMRGCYIECKAEDCDKWMHVTCARSSGLCNVYHGNDHLGTVESEKAWSLFCPEHSTFEPDHIPAGTSKLEKLRDLAKTFPLEPKPEPPPKEFHRMNRKERTKYLANPEYEEEFFEKIKNKGIDTTRCEVCNMHGIILENSSDSFNESGLLTCHVCGSSAHGTCLTEKWEQIIDEKKQHKVTCTRCLYVKENKNDKDFHIPDCHMCNKKDGALVRAVAVPIASKKWKTKKSAFKRTLFGRQIWCHPVCGMWHPKCNISQGKIDCTAIVMANGSTHIESNQTCSLCGLKNKIKLQCAHTVAKKKCPLRFHLTCARQAGLEVSHDDTCESFTMKCFQHSNCYHNLRALLEDMIEVVLKEKSNNGGRTNMSLECAANIFNMGVKVLQTLGWAWQWGEWWVQLGDTWEPLLEDGQKEEEMTKEQLRVVDSTKESRCDDARRCRLAAFGAALRNRDYDKEEDDDREPLQRALRAVLSTPSLVGPLQSNEIDFFTDWLARVYRSRSPLLGFGNEKIPVEENWTEGSCVHFHDKSPKFLLNSRTLPGKQTTKGKVFEESVNEADDFCPDDIPLNIVLRSPEKMHLQSQNIHNSQNISDEPDPYERRSKARRQI